MLRTLATAGAIAAALGASIACSTAEGTRSPHTVGARSDEPNSATAGESIEVGSAGTTRGMLAYRVVCKTASGDPVAGAVVWMIGRDRSAAAVMRATIEARTTGDLVQTMKRLRISELAVTDERGVATLSAPDHGGDGLFAAEAGALFGQVERRFGALRGPDASSMKPIEVPLKLASRTALHVRAVDGTGTSVPNVRVGAALQDDYGRLTFLPLVAQTDAHGEATLYAPKDAFGKRSADAVIVARFASDEPVVERWFSTGDVVTLVLPTTNRITVEVPSLPGESEPLAGFVQLFAAREGSVSKRTLGTRFEQGQAAIGPVAIGIPLRCTALLRRASAADAAMLGRVHWRVAAGEVSQTGRVRVPLGGHVRLRGHVATGPSGLSEGTIIEFEILGQPGSPWMSAVGPDGAFEWLAPSVPGGKLRLRAAGREAIVDIPLGETEAAEVIELGRVALEDP